jgi:hypothetical protein
METKKDILNRLFVENNLTSEDVFKHQHYTIITRSGIEKIMNNLQIYCEYEVIKCEPHFAVVKAKGETTDREGGEKFVQTFGSALRGTNYQDGNTNTWYVMEMAEKRAMSRAVLKLAGFYEFGVFGEDESESFKKNNN